MGFKHCVCGKTIKPSRSLCATCLTEYGPDSAAWPEWVRFLVADERHTRGQMRDHQELSLPADDRYPSERSDPVSASWNYIRDYMMP